MIPEDPDGAASGRRYTEKEVALVIKRASELQAEQSAQEDTAGSGLSLAELEQVAREAGLDPALVRRAAQDIDARLTVAAPSPFLGAPSVIVIERTIRGEVPSAEYEAIVEIIRRRFNDPGYITTFGHSLSWSATPQHRRGRSVSITVTARNGNTVVRGEESLRGVAGGLFGGIMGGVGGGTTGVTLGLVTAVTHSALFGVGAWVAVLAGTYGLARTIFGVVANRRGEQLRLAVEQVAEHVAATAATPANALPPDSTSAPPA